MCSQFDWTCPLIIFHDQESKSEWSYETVPFEDDDSPEVDLQILFQGSIFKLHVGWEPCLDSTEHSIISVVVGGA